MDPMEGSEGAGGDEGGAFAMLTINKPAPHKGAVGFGKAGFAGFQGELLRLLAGLERQAKRSQPTRSPLSRHDLRAWVGLAGEKVPTHSRPLVFHC
jgi:hypothetical protein